MISIRWILVIGVICWLGYEYAAPLINHIWTQYAIHIKFMIGVVVVFCLLCLPSIENLARTYPSIYTLIRQFVIDDGLHTDYQQSLPISNDSVRQRVQRGMTLATG